MDEPAIIVDGSLPDTQCCCNGQSHLFSNQSFIYPVTQWGRKIWEMHLTIVWRYLPTLFPILAPGMLPQSPNTWAYLMYGTRSDQEIVTSMLPKTQANVRIQCCLPGSFHFPGSRGFIRTKGGDIHLTMGIQFSALPASLPWNMLLLSFFNDCHDQLFLLPTFSSKQQMSSFLFFSSSLVAYC